MNKSFWGTLPRPIIALAPMEGVTDSAFRQTCKHHGADVVYTEFISSDAIGHNARRAFEKMSYDPMEQPVLCQIFGKNSEMFVKAAQEIERRGFAGIDVNLGCPARTVVKHGAGVALLRTPEFARELLARVLDAVTIPVSIKIRTKIRKERRELASGTQEWHTALELLEAIADLPIAAVMVHGRSFEQGHTGDVDAEMIRAVKERFTKGPVLANGGIFAPERVKTMLKETGADGVGIARGAQGNPWIFNQSKQYLAHGSYDIPSWNNRAATALQHAERAVKLKGDWGIVEMRKHLLAYVKGLRNASSARQALARVTTVEEISTIFDQMTNEATERFSSASLPVLESVAEKGPLD